MKPIIDHIQITVKDMAVAEPFYTKLMPLLGFDRGRKHSAYIESHEFHVIEWSHELLAFAITSPRPSVADESLHRRKPGALHHLAFAAKSRKEVDRMYEEVKRIGATIVTPPKEYPEYVPAGYYALFFKDPEGIKYEIVHYPNNLKTVAYEAGSG